jgi:hypothetical protein
VVRRPPGGAKSVPSRAPVALSCLTTKLLSPFFFATYPVPSRSRAMASAGSRSPATALERMSLSSDAVKRTSYPDCFEKAWSAAEAGCAGMSKWVVSAAAVRPSARATGRRMRDLRFTGWDGAFPF